MKHKDNMFHTQMAKCGDSLEHTSSFGSEQYKEFLARLGAGQLVDVFMDANVDDGSLAQLAKIHKCIREIAKETGSNFDDVKLEVKNKVGLCIKKELDGEMYMICKSLSKCSKEELGMVIQGIIDIGDLIGINFR